LVLRRNRVVRQHLCFARLPTSPLRVFITWLLHSLPTEMLRWVLTRLPIVVLRKLPRVLSAVLLRVVILDGTPDL